MKTTRRRELPVAPDPAQVLTDLRELLTPLLADHSLLTDQVVLHAPPPTPAPPATPAHGCDNQPPITGSLSQPAAEAMSEMAVNEAAGEANHTVQAPGQVRGPRSASFLTAPTPELTGRYAEVRAANGLIRGAELLTVGSGEEESW